MTTTVYLATDDGLIKANLDNAQRRADREGRTLRKVSEKDGIPIYKSVDEGKEKYEKNKKNKKSKRVDVKEIRIRPVTDDHDLQRLIKQGSKFLSQGHKVKITCKFSGRENSHRELGMELIQKMIQQMNAELDGGINSAHNNINVLIKNAG